MSARIALGAVVALVLVSCGSSEDSSPATTQQTDRAATTTAQTAAETTQATTVESTTSTAPAGDDECAHVIAATIEPSGEGQFTVSATVRSDDTGWEKYADLWEVRTVDGEVLGQRVLAHPHENEQPFTRSVGGVEIPGDVAEVVVIAHDLVAGFCGESVTIGVPHP